MSHLTLSLMRTKGFFPLVLFFFFSRAENLQRDISEHTIFIISIENQNNFCLHTIQELFQEQKMAGGCLHGFSPASFHSPKTCS